MSVTGGLLALRAIDVAFRRIHDRQRRVGLNVLQTADHKVHHTFVEAVSLGIWLT